MRRLSGLLGLSVVLLWLAPGKGLAQSCAYQGAAAPAATTRTYRNADLAIAFEIPANYRAMGLAGGRVAFYDPHTFEHVQCAVRKGQVAQGKPAALLDLSYTPLPETDLLALVQRVRPWLVFYQPTYQPIEPNGVSALEYRYTQRISGNAVLALSFRSADQRWLVTLEGAPNNPVTPLLQTTLQQ